MRKKILLIATVFLLAAPFACDDLLTVEDAAQKASRDFCDCYKTKSLSDCEKELNSKYSSYVNNDDFYSAFNNANSCGVTIYKK
jgi:hypothetical protein